MIKIYNKCHKEYNNIGYITSPITRCLDGKWICNRCIDADISGVRDIIKEELKINLGITFVNGEIK